MLAVTAASGYLALLAWIGWQSFLIAILVPMFLLYHVSALLQFLTEHAWNIAEGPVQDWDEYKRRCWSRFCGEAFPCQEQRGVMRSLVHLAACVWWGVRMLIVHLPVRIACLVADLPVHDWHHLAHMAGQNARDWTRSVYMREMAIANGDLPGFAGRELWGLPNMIEHQFNWLESIVCQYLPPAGYPCRASNLIQKESHS